MYEARLAHDCGTDRPEWYFQRRTVPRLDADLHEYASDLWANGQDLLRARQANWHPKNHKACMYKHSPCKFLALCAGQDTQDSDHWQVKQQVHVELPDLAGDGRGVLTNSRVGEFLLCRRKHFLSYEVGLERVDEEEAEALFFGTLYHLAQEAYWRAAKEIQQQNQKGEVNVSNDSGAPENGFGIANDATAEAVTF